VIGIFKQKNPGNTLVLFFYALALKFSSFLYPLPPLRQAEDSFLYNALLDFLRPLNIADVIYAILAFILLLIQANLFNRIISSQRMFTRASFLPAMSYILLSSLFIEWNQFSAPLLINTLLIWIFYKIASLYNSSNPNVSVFNIGLLLGILALFYEPAVIFILLIPFSLFIMRPFRVREWLIGFLGVTTPFYFVAVILYLTDQFSFSALIPFIGFDLPAIPSSIFVTISISLLVIPFIIGGYYVQDNLNKMLIQIRKTWSILLIFLIISVLLILVSGGDRYVNWICCLVPLSAFHAAAYFYPEKSKLPWIIHWLVFGFAIFINYFPEFTV
jgi:hypothetical protein